MAHKTCECCGQTLPDFYIEIAERGRLSKKETALFVAVAGRAGRLVAYGGIIDRLWGDDPDGGPLAPLNNISIHVLRINRKLAHTDYRIENVWGQGYRLVTISQQAVA